MVGFADCAKNIEVDNDHPHVTLLLSNNAKAVESNDILELVFKERPEILK